MNNNDVMKIEFLGGKFFSMIDAKKADPDKINFPIIDY